MSEIRQRIIKILEESNISFMDNVEESLGNVTEGAINDVMKSGEDSWEAIAKAADDQWDSGTEDTPDIEGAVEDEIPSEENS